MILYGNNLILTIVCTWHTHPHNPKNIKMSFLSFYRIKIIWSAPKNFELDLKQLCSNKFCFLTNIKSVWFSTKMFGPAQNSFGPVEGQAISWQEHAKLFNPKSTHHTFQLTKIRTYLFTFVGSKIRSCFPARFLTNFPHKWIAVLIKSANIQRCTTFCISFYPPLTMWSLVWARVCFWIFLK